MPAKTPIPLTRERLLHLLAEASELEHNLLCSYLFAVFSLKRRQDEQLNPDEFAAIQRWRKVLLGVCIEEMTHLAQVANLTAALGAVPHFNRPNLPVAPGYHPAEIVIALTPFSVETLEHFVFLERPDSASVDDGSGFADSADRDAPRDHKEVPLTPSAPEYATVGEFYALIGSSLKAFAEEKGEAIFARDVFQLAGELIKSPSLVVVKTIEDAMLAIDRIVEQGEGASQQCDNCHFSRFTDMLEEFRRLKHVRPEFEPARLVGPNPVLRAPQAADRTHVRADDARLCLDAFNAVYWMMLRSLTALYAHGAKAAVAEALVTHMLDSMHLLSDIAGPLTEQPASEGARLMAGPSFTMSRHTEGAATAECAVLQLIERCGEIGSSLAALPIDEALQLKLNKKLSSMAADLELISRT